MGKNLNSCKVKSILFIQSVEKEFNVVLLDKMNLAYRNNANEIEIEALPKFQDLISSNKVSESTIVFNNLVENLGQMRSDWETTASNSWHKQLFL